MKVKDLKPGDRIMIKISFTKEPFVATILSIIDRSAYEHGKRIECGLINYRREDDGRVRACDIQYVQGFAENSN